MVDFISLLEIHTLLCLQIRLFSLLANPEHEMILGSRGSVEVQRD